MIKSIAIHSHKGGVGKTTIAINMAVSLAKQGKNVCLFDFDFIGPNLFTFFKDNDIKKYLNDFFWNKVPISECLINAKEIMNLDGNLYVGFANPSSDSINKFLELSSNQAMKMLTDIFQLRSVLQKEPYNIDYLILDTTPGLAIQTVNSFLVADTILFIIKFSNSDIDGTVELISGLLNSLTAEMAVVANNIPEEVILSDNELLNIEKLIIERIQTQIDTNVNFLGWLPNDHSLQLIEYNNAINRLKGCDTRRTIHTLDIPMHPITIGIGKIISKIK